MIRQLRRHTKLIGTDHQLYRAIRFRTNRHEYGTMAEKNLMSPLMNIRSTAGDRMTDATSSSDCRPTQSRVQRRYDSNGRLRARKDRARRKESVVSHSGMRTSSALGLLLAVCLVFSVFYFSGRSLIASRRTDLNLLQNQLIRSIAMCDDLELRYQAARAETDAAYSAKDLGLVSSSSLPLTVLTVPGGDYEMGASSMVLPSDSLAIIFGN